MDPVAIEYLMDGRIFDEFDLENTLRQIRCPALLLAGEVELGGLVRDSDMELFTSLVEYGTATRVTGVGHNVLDKDPITSVLSPIQRLLQVRKAARHP
jgi:pimeloyl-ACP methyl ester carboxylesterase